MAESDEDLVLDLREEDVEIVGMKITTDEVQLIRKFREIKEKFRPGEPKTVGRSTVIMVEGLGTMAVVLSLQFLR